MQAKSYGLRLKLRTDKRERERLVPQAYILINPQKRVDNMVKRGVFVGSKGRTAESSQTCVWGTLQVYHPLIYLRKGVRVVWWTLQDHIFPLAPLSPTLGCSHCSSSPGPLGPLLFLNRTHLGGGGDGAEMSACLLSGLPLIYLQKHSDKTLSMLKTLLKFQKFLQEMKCRKENLSQCTKQMIILQNQRKGKRHPFHRAHWTASSCSDGLKAILLFLSLKKSPYYL